MKRLFRIGVSALVVAAGCSAPPPPPEQAASHENESAAVAVIVPTPTKTPAVQAPVPPPVAPKPEPFRFADDRGGKQVERAVAPAPPTWPGLTKTTQPKSRTTAAERGELPLAPARVSAATIPMPARKIVPPSAPSERLTVDMQIPPAPRVKTLPIDSKFPIPAPANVPAVAELPIMARQIPDKIPLDDTSAELSSARIVSTNMTAPALISPFLKLILPDPFELAEQIRLRTPTDTNLTPVPVPAGKR